MAIVGPPNSGKTTLCNELRQLGIRVVQEQATKLILSGGPMPWDDHEQFQFTGCIGQLSDESDDGSEVCDRGVFDFIPFRWINGWTVLDFFDRVNPRRYNLAVALQPLEGWHDDGVRYECPIFARDIAPLFIRAYEERGIPVLRPPLLAKKELVDYVLKTLDIDRRCLRAEAA